MAGKLDEIKAVMSDVDNALEKAVKAELTITIYLLRMARMDLSTSAEDEFGYRGAMFPGPQIKLTKKCPQ
jgi:hypothetical protein